MKTHENYIGKTLEPWRRLALSNKISLRKVE